MWLFKLSDRGQWRLEFLFNQGKLCMAPGPGVVSVNLAILCAALVVVSVFEWSVCEVCLSKHSPVMFTQQQGKYNNIFVQCILQGSH